MSAGPQKLSRPPGPLGDGAQGSRSGYAVWGDMGNIAILLNAIIFMVCVVAQAPVFDRQWRINGFCQKNVDDRYASTHAWCFYIDAVSSVVIVLIAYFLKNLLPAGVARNVFTNAAGIFGHGCGHFGISFALASAGGNTPELKGIQELVSTTPPLELALRFSILLFFWVTLLSAALTESTWPQVLAAAATVFVAGFWVPPHLGFTYVQTVLLIAASITQLGLSSERKNTFQYAAFALIVGLPIGFVGWIESTSCTNFLLDWGGHIWYDSCIPVSLLIYLVLCAAKSPPAKIDAQAKSKLA